MFRISEKNPYETPFAASAPLHLFLAAEETNQSKTSKPSPVGSSCKGQGGKKHRLFQSLAAWAFLNLQRLLRAKGMGNQPEKYKQGTGGCACIKGGNRKRLQKTRAKERFSCIFASSLMGGRSVQEEDRINKSQWTCL